MGSDLYTITVQKIKKRTATLHIKVIHPDAGMFIENKNIPLQLIVGAYWLLKMGYTWDMNISKEEAKKILEKSPYIKQLDNWLELMHGQEINITEAEYKALQEAKEKIYNNRQVASYGSGNGTYHLSFATEYRAFVDLAEVMILEIKVDGEHLIFEVLEEGMIAHLYEGMSWASRAYDFTYYANR